MGQTFRKPVHLNPQESLKQEANRLLQSYQNLIYEIGVRGKLDSFDGMKQNSIHQHWFIIFPLLHNSPEKEKFAHKFNEYSNLFSFYKYGLNEQLDVIYEEHLLS